MKVNLRVVKALGISRHPRPQNQAEILSGHNGFAPVYVRGARNQNAHPVDLQAVQTFDAVVDVPIVTPPHEPEGGGPVEKVVFSRPLPNEMPRVLRVDADGAAAVTVRRAECSRVRFLKTALPVHQGISVVPGGGGHEADAEDAAIGGITEAAHFELLAASCLPKLPFDSDVQKRDSARPETRRSA